MHGRVVCGWVVAIAAPVLVTLLLLVVGDGRSASGTILFDLAIFAAACAGRVGPGLVATALAIIGATACVGQGVTFDAFDDVRIATMAVLGIAITFTLHALGRARASAARLERASQTSDQRFARTFDESPVPMSLSRLDTGLVIAANDAYLTTFGVTRDEIIGSTPSEAGILVTGVDRDALFAQLLGGEDVRDAEVTLTTRGVSKTVILWSQRMLIEGVAFALSTFLDLTDRRNAEAAARQSDARFAELAENLAEVFWLTDPRNTQMLYVSPAYETIFGRTCAQLYADPRDWLLAVHPDDRARMAASISAPLVEARSTIYRIVRPDGGVRTVRANTFPVRDGAGDVIRMAGIGSDITAQFELEEQVRQTQKLESLGLLAGGVAHDFNNILAVVAANASLLGETVPLGHADHELVEEIEAAVTRATSLTRQLLAFSRKQLVEPVVIDLNAAVNDTRKMLRRMVGEDVVIESSLDPDLCHVRMDPGYLVQVLMNLAVNARDAMPRGGRLSISTRNVADAGQVMIVVADTGCGMPPEVKARALEPFFTTKGVGKGTGLGLSVVHGIVQQAGGTIEIETEPGVGTTFRIVLPAVDQPADPIGNVATIGAVGTEKILLVDDDLHVRSSASRALRSRGYTVLEAGDGHTALRLLRDHGAGIELLITDVVMPGMDGTELASLARGARPDLRVLYTSGYTDDLLAHHGVNQGTEAFIEKPFRLHAFAGKIRQMLDAA